MAPPRHRRSGLFPQGADMACSPAMSSPWSARVGRAGAASCRALRSDGFAGLRRGAAQDRPRPIARGRRSARDRVASAVDEHRRRYFARRHRRTRELRRELEIDAQRADRGARAAPGKSRLKALLKLGADNATPVARGAPASVRPRASTRRFAMLGAGRNRGVARRHAGARARRADRPRARGRPSVSRVLLLTDVDNVVPVRRARDGVPALATGAATAMLDIRALNIGDQPVQARRHLRHFGHGRALPAQHPGRDRRRGAVRRRDRRAARRSRRGSMRRWSMRASRRQRRASRPPRRRGRQPRDDRCADAGERFRARRRSLAAMRAHADRRGDARLGCCRRCCR